MSSVVSTLTFDFDAWQFISGEFSSRLELVSHFIDY